MIASFAHAPLCRPMEGLSVHAQRLAGLGKNEPLPLPLLLPALVLCSKHLNYTKETKTEKNS